MNIRSKDELMGKDSVVDRGSDGRTTLRIRQAERGGMCKDCQRHKSMVEIVYTANGSVVDLRQ